MADEETTRLGKKELGERLRWHHLILLHRECVRRNSTYAKDYYTLQAVAPQDRRAWALTLEEHWGLWTCGKLPDPTSRPDLQQLKRATPSPKELLRYEEFDDPLEATAEEQLFRVLHRTTDAETVQPLKGFAFFLYFPEEPGPAVRYAALDMRRTQKELKGFFDDLLQDVIASREKYHLKQIPPPKRLRVEEMFDYLRAYDLKQKNRDYDEITRDLWPGQQKSTLGWEYVKKAEQLICDPPLASLLKGYLRKRSDGRSLSLEDFNPQIVVPKTRARLRGQGYEGQTRWRLGPVLVRTYPRNTSANHQEPDIRRKPKGSQQ